MLRILAAAALTLMIGTGPAAAASATAFGDSFTAGRSWYGQLHLGDDNFAKGGAAANPDFANVPTNTLAGQLQRWRAAGKPTNDWMTAPTMLPFSGLSGQRSSRARIFGRATDGVAASSR
jgi:hypothetical protein